MAISYRIGHLGHLDWGNTLTKGLIGAWPFDDRQTDTLLDYSPYLAHATLQAGTVELENTNVGRAIRFNSTAYYAVPSHSPCITAPFDGDCTVLLLAARGGYTDTAAAFAWGADLSTSDDLIFTPYSTTGGNGFKTFWRNHGASLTAVHSLAGTGIHAFAQVSKTDGSRTVYVNGVSGNTQGPTGTGTTFDSLYIGAWNSDGTPTQFYGAGVDGPIASAFVWNRILTDEEIRRVSRDPWQMFRPPAPTIFLPTAAPASIAGWDIGAAQQGGWDIGATQHSTSTAGTPVDILAPLLSAGASLLAPIVGVGISEAAKFQRVASDLLEPLIGVGVSFPVGSTLQSRSPLLTPIVGVQFDVTPDTLLSGATLHEPVAGVGVDGAPDLQAQGATLHEPTVVIGTEILPDLQAQGATLHEPIVGTGIDIASDYLQAVCGLKTPTVDTAISAPLLQYGAALWQPTVALGQDIQAVTLSAGASYYFPQVNEPPLVVTIPFTFHYYAHVPLVKVVSGQIVKTQKKRVFDAIAERADVGIYLPASVDGNTRLLTIGHDGQSVYPSTILVNEVTSQMSLASRNRQSDRDERNNWSWELILQFSEPVTVEPFEKSLLETPIRLPHDATNELGSVRLRFLDSRYEHPPQQNSSSGTRVIMTFEADLSPV